MQVERMLKITVSICICTRKRSSGLRHLLQSIAEMNLPDESIYTVQVMVVENDSEERSRFVIQEFEKLSHIQIRYFLETNQGLCYARNRSVRESKGVTFCVFVDDDQTVDSNWLIELLRCQKEFNCDAVYGTNPPIFERQVEKFVKEFHTPSLYKYGLSLKAAPTNSLLIKYDIINRFDGPFDLRLNFLGGEDIFLTESIVRGGGVIISNPNAVAYEIVPLDRTFISYLIRRSFRNGNTYSNVFLLVDRSFADKLMRFFNLLLRFAYGIIISIPLLLFYSPNRFKGFLKITFNLGGLFGFFHYKMKFYK